MPLDYQLLGSESSVLSTRLSYYLYRIGTQSIFAERINR